MTDPAEEDLPNTTSRPANCRVLFWAFTRMALQGFGGVLAIAQIELVERLRWLRRDEFVEMLSIAQVLPGPNIVNLCLMIGDRCFGARGAFTALAGMLLFPSLLVLALAAVYSELATHPVAVNALRGMGAVSAGLILSTGVKLLPSLKKNPMGRLTAAVLAVLTLIAIAVLRLPLPWLVLCLGGLGMALAWRQLK